MLRDRFPVLVVEERSNANRSYHDYLGCVSRTNGRGYVTSMNFCAHIFKQADLCMLPRDFSAWLPSCKTQEWGLNKKHWGLPPKWKAFLKVPFWNRASMNEPFVCYSCHPKAKWKLQWAWTRLLRGSSCWVLKTLGDRETAQILNVMNKWHL